MRQRPSYLLLLLAAAVAFGPLRAAGEGHSVRGAHDGHIHHHAHAHDGADHAHAHYHHHGERGACGSDDHDEVLDHVDPGPMRFWTAPPRTEVPAPPPIAAAFAAPGATGAAALRRPRAKPPPRGPDRPPALRSITTTVLRL